MFGHGDEVRRCIRQEKNSNVDIASCSEVATDALKKVQIKVARREQMWHQSMQVRSKRFSKFHGLSSKRRWEVATR